MSKKTQTLVVDDDRSIRELLGSQVSYMGYEVRTAGSGDEALQLAAVPPHPEIVLSDVNMPGLPGTELLVRLLELDPRAQVIMITGEGDLDTVRRCLRAGAYDYLVKPYDLEELTVTMSRARERRHLLQEVHDHRLSLERRVEEKTREVLETRDIALLSMAKLAECRDDTTGYHLDRIQWYCRSLAEQMQTSHAAVTPEFIETLFKSSPLHDIGKVAIPDGILLKKDKLTGAEWSVMKTHTVRGGDTLREIIEHRQAPAGASFLRMAMEIAYQHHERWDGSGYPAGLAGNAISLGARIVAVGDAYDAITSARPYEPACSHEEAVERIARDRGTHFDPEVLDSFLACQAKFDLVRKQMSAKANETRPGELDPGSDPSRSESGLGLDPRSVSHH